MHLSQPSGLFKVLLQRGFPSAYAEPGVRIQYVIASGLENSFYCVHDLINVPVTRAADEFVAKISPY